MNNAHGMPTPGPRGAPPSSIFGARPRDVGPRVSLPEEVAIATVRTGNQPVLLVVDTQVGVVSGCSEARRVVQNLARVVERARAAAVPVMWVQHGGTDLVVDSPPWQWVPELQPAPSEPRVHKQFNSSFEQTTLDDELTKVGATHIVLAGAATNWCIRATAYGALDRGYDLTLVQDAHTTETMAFEDGTRIEAASVVRELNVAMTWLRYPGRTNGTATANEIDFATPGGARQPP